MSDRQLLEDERIASLRLVQFRDVATGAPVTPQMLEIETKSGRYCHLQPSTTDDGVLLRSGPARMRSDPGTTARHWQDLTEILPGAFDGRPVVTALHADDPYGPRSARAWTFALSTGYRVRCACHRGALQVTGEEADSQEARR